MNMKTRGEIAFEEYLNGQRIPFEYEPRLDFTSNLIDYVVDHPTEGRIYFEVKDIDRPPPGRSFIESDPYAPIRAQIKAATEKFKDFSDHLCALVLFAPPGSIVKLMMPHVMLGSMYGNLGFTIPFNIETGVGA